MKQDYVFGSGSRRLVVMENLSGSIHFRKPAIAVFDVPATTRKRIFSVDVFTNVFRVPRRADCFLFNDCQSLLPSPFDFKQ